MISCPSCPMLTRPARLLTIVPSATRRIGADTPKVSPQRPGLRMLPSSIAVYTLAHEPPVADTQIAANASATNKHTTYRTITSVVDPNLDRCAAGGAASGCSVSRTSRSPTSATDTTHHQAQLGEVDLVTLHLADDMTVRDNDDPIGEVKDLLELRRDQQHRHAGRGDGAQL